MFSWPERATIIIIQIAAHVAALIPVLVSLLQIKKGKRVSPLAYLY